MAKFNDYTHFFDQIEKIPFEFKGVEFTVKNTHTNAIILESASEYQQEMDLEELRLNSKIKAKTATKEEQAEFAVKKAEVGKKFEKALKTVLGEDQFKKLQELEFTTKDLYILFSIVFGLVSGATHEQIMEQLEKMFNPETGELKENEEM